MIDDQISSLNLHDLTVLSPLGHGARGVVFLVRNKSSGEVFALKTILKSSLAKKTNYIDCHKESLFEQEVLRLAQHPLLPKLRGVVHTDSIIGYAIDYCPGRDLNHLRYKQTERMFSDDVIRFYAAELVLALEYLHSLGIVYRDLKPENIMIQENGHLMLVDFDLSTKLSIKSHSETRPTPTMTSLQLQQSPSKKTRFSFLTSCCKIRSMPLEDSVHPAESVNSETSCTESYSKSNSFVGTEEYVAPEMLQSNGHGFAVDYWCLGIVLHEMLYGKTPFKGKNRKETFNKIIKESLELMGEPTPLRGLIKKLLVKDQKERISTVEIKSHEFFKGLDWEQVMEISRPPFVPGSFDEEECIDVNKIDIEAFVQGVFHIDDDVYKKDETHELFVF